jgi:uncharacterized membrane protein
MMPPTPDDREETPAGRPAQDAEPDESERDRRIRQAELIISNVLRGGVSASAAIILLGVVLFYLRALTSGHTPSVKPFPTSLPAVWSGLAHGDPLAIIALGLLLLLATPVVRVAVSIVAFALEGDRRYVIITTLVLLILIASFVLGKAGA